MIHLSFPLPLSPPSPFQVDYSTFPRVVGYCEQMDCHLPTATVEEALLFSAQLRLDQTIALEDKRHFVKEVGVCEEEGEEEEEEG